MRRHRELPLQRGHLGRLAQDLEQPLGDQLRRHVEVGAVEQHEELVTGHTGGGVAVADDAVQPRGHDAQKLIAGRVAEGVVDVLEAVHVEVQRRDRQLLAASAGEHLLGAIHGQSAVGQPGERVVHLLVAELSGPARHEHEGALMRAAEHRHQQRQEEAYDRAPEEQEEPLLTGRQPAGDGGPADDDTPGPVDRGRTGLAEGARGRRGPGLADELLRLARIGVIEGDREAPVRPDGRANDVEDVERAHRPAGGGGPALGRRPQRCTATVERGLDEAGQHSLSGHREGDELVPIGRRLKQRALDHADRGVRAAPITLDQLGRRRVE
jgi:hypothetical protein